MLGRKHKGILSLNLKKLANRVDDFKINLILLFAITIIINVAINTFL